MATEVLTERLLLREFIESDWRAMHAMASDERVTRYIPVGAPTVEETRESIQVMMAGRQASPPRYDFAVTLRSASPGLVNTPIGVCGLFIRYDELGQGEILYVLGHRYWGQGYATEAARALLGYGFRELDLHRIYATCRPANVASARVMEKLGMRREGHLRQHRWMKGRWQDSLLYAILDHEWEALSQ
jgi:RimJ/RimL family protein N-acetyltransferase